MTWTSALTKLNAGKRIRRSEWYTALILRNNRVEWDITETLARQCNCGGGASRVYREWKPDMAADDWILAT